MPRLDVSQRAWAFLKIASSTLSQALSNAEKLFYIYLKVVYRAAERDVVLMQEYNDLHTKNERQKQAMLLTGQ